MIIVLEGVDGVGKTTVANAIQEQLNVPYIKYYSFSSVSLWRKYEEFKSFIEYRLIEQFAKKFDIDFTVTRLWIGNKVYSKVFQRKNPKYLKPFVPAAVIYLYATEAEILKRKNDPFISYNMIHTLLDTYFFEVKKFKRQNPQIPVLELDTTFKTKEQAWSTVISWLRRFLKK